VLGYDAAGIVEAVGSDVSLFRPGDEVFYAGARDRPGTNAEFHLVDERIVGLKPKTLSFAEAAALPLTSITAWEILFDRMRVPYGSKKPCGALVVLNGAGGVGSIMIQLAARLTGLTVIATASRPETTDWVRKLGASHVADHRRPLDEAVKAIGFDGIDYLAAITSTPGSVPAIAAAMNPQGHITFIDNFDESILPFKAKSITISWEMMFTRSLFQTKDMDAQHRLLSEVSALVDAGVLRSTLTQNLGRISAENLRKAHAASKAEECSARWSWNGSNRDSIRLIVVGAAARTDRLKHLRSFWHARRRLSPAGVDQHCRYAPRSDRRPAAIACSR